MSCFTTNTSSASFAIEKAIPSCSNSLRGNFDKLPPRLKRAIQKVFLKSIKESGLEKSDQISCTWDGKEIVVTSGSDKASITKESSPCLHKEFRKALKHAEIYANGISSFRVREDKSTYEKAINARQEQSAAHQRSRFTSRQMSLLVAPSWMGDVTGLISKELGSSSAILGGSLALFSGASLMIRGHKTYREAQFVGDKEGVLAGSLEKSLGGALFLAGSNAMISTIANLEGVGKITSITGAAVIPLKGFVSGVALIRGSVLLKQVISFRSQLNEYLENDGLTDTEKHIGAFHFLYDHLTVTDVEKEQLASKIKEKNSNLSKEEITYKIEEALEKRIQKKMLRFERKIGKPLAEKIIANYEEWSKDSSGHFSEIKEVVKEVEKVTFKKSVGYVFMIIAALMGIASIFLTGGVGMIIMGVASLMWLIFDLGHVDKLGEAFWKLREKYRQVGQEPTASLVAK